MSRPVLFAGTALAVLAAAASAQETPLFSPVFTDNAVLQRGAPIPVFGTAEPGASVSVRLGDGRVRRVRTGDDGRWEMSLPARKPAEGLTLTATAGGQTQTLQNIAVGEVYLCSGQSNMEFQTRYATNAYFEVSTAGNEALRLFTVPRRIADAPVRDFEGAPSWQVAETGSVADFSAVCYFFGRQMQAERDVRVGLIASSWGGTIIEAWMSDETLGTVEAVAGRVEIERLARDNAEDAKRAYDASLNAWWEEQDLPTDIFTRTGGSEIDASALWEGAGLSELRQFDGLAVYRTTVTLTEEQAGGGATMSLGPIDDVDVTYINGTRVGSTYGYSTPRTYDIPDGVLQAGDNLIAIGVLDTGGGGGLYGPDEVKTLTLTSGETVSLADGWMIETVAPMSALSTPPDSPSAGPNAYSVLYNGMIAPIVPYGINGVLWYQGESNVIQAGVYDDLMTAWIENWREDFRDEDLPFFIVQLADFGQPAMNEPQDSGWARLREAQRRVVNADTRVGMAVTWDIGDRFDIHPTQKRIVAERLARQANAILYGDDSVAQGPEPASVTSDGETVSVRMQNGPLVTYGSNRPIGFELCTPEGECRFADATVDGETVTLRTPPEMTDPATVRFCWADAPVCNLYNEADLPAVPFEMAIDAD